MSVQARSDSPDPDDLANFVSMNPVPPGTRLDGGRAFGPRSKVLSSRSHPFPATVRTLE